MYLIPGGKGGSVTEEDDHLSGVKWTRTRTRYRGFLEVIYRVSFNRTRFLGKRNARLTIRIHVVARERFLELDESLSGRVSRYVSS